MTIPPGFIELRPSRDLCVLQRFVGLRVFHHPTGQGHGYGVIEELNTNDYFEGYSYARCPFVVHFASGYRDVYAPIDLVYEAIVAKFRMLSF